jgi:hypothetical protein
LRLTGAARDDARMPSARTAPLPLGPIPALAALAALSALCLLAPACGEHAPAPVVVPSDIHLAAAQRARPAAAAAPPGSSAAADRLQAARTVALYCRLLDQGQFARAARLCARRRLWSRHALAGVARFHFRSARVYAAPDARTLVLQARVRVRAGRGCPLPDGLAVLFFTLGRVGSAVGGWLITAVSTSP